MFMKRSAEPQHGSDEAMSAESEAIDVTDDVGRNTRKVYQAPVRWRVYFWLHMIIVVGWVITVRLDRAGEFGLIYQCLSPIVGLSLPWILISPLISAWMAFLGKKTSSRYILLVALADFVLCGISFVCMHLAYQ